MRKPILAAVFAWMWCAFQAGLQAQSITNEPQSITVNTASTATFTVGATGAAGYQWKFNGTPLSDGGNITGSATSSLTIDDVLSNQAGSYTVVVDGQSPVTSSPAAVLMVTNGTIVQFTLTGFMGGGSSNITVQLFDHDKPATVQNFLHYIQAGAFTNMFFERCIPGFVLQGGSYDANDKTTSVPPIMGSSIHDLFTASANYSFPPQVDNEFSNGPIVPNHFGTIAMATLSGDLDSATSGFFFNLADNSSTLDQTSNYFTVFGRILNGTNTLQYFNGLATNAGIVTNELFEFDGFIFTNEISSTLPVNYFGSAEPANANLVFGSITASNPPPVDNVSPTVSISSPAPNALITNSESAGTFTGTALDNVAVAVVTGVAIPLEAADGTYPTGSPTPITNYATGTSNWSLTFAFAQIINGQQFGTQPLRAGSYSVTFEAQDGAGNLSTAKTQTLTITDLITNGNGSIKMLPTYGNATNVNPIGYPIQPGSNYEVEAVPAPGWLFKEWTNSEYLVAEPDLPFSVSDAPEVFTAVFITNGLPNAATITFPAANSITSTDTFTVTGTLNYALTPPANVSVGIVYQPGPEIFGGYDFLPVNAAISGTNWSASFTNIGTGAYTVQATVTDGLGNQTIATQNFTSIMTASVTNPPSLSQFFVDSLPDVSGTATSYYSLTNVTVSLEPYTAYGVESEYSYKVPAPIGTNWSVSLASNFSYIMPGSYNLGVSVADVDGNTYPEGGGAAAQPLTISAFNTNGSGTIAFVAGAPTNFPPIGYALQPGDTYEVIATPATNWQFAAWQADGEVFLGPVLNFPMEEGFTATAYFLTNGASLSSVLPTTPVNLVILGNGNVSGITNRAVLPVGLFLQLVATPSAGSTFLEWSGSAGVSFSSNQSFFISSNMTIIAEFAASNAPSSKILSVTSPAPNAKLYTNNFTVKGRIAPTAGSAQITCSFVSKNSTTGFGNVFSTTASKSFSIPVTGLPPDNYIMQVFASYEENGVTNTAVVTQNLSILDFKPVAGTYSGLFICDNYPPSPTNSGYLTFTLAANGAISGKFELPGYRVSNLRETFFADGLFYLPTTNSDNPFVISLSLGLTNNFDVVTGYIASTLSNGWYSPLVCYRNAPKVNAKTFPAAGRYALGFGTATNAAATNGYAVFNIGAGGSVAVTGGLQDGTAFSESTHIGTNGVWPLYVVPPAYDYKGAILGWVTNNPAGAVSGQLFLIRSNTLSATLAADGANYTGVPAGAYNLVFSGSGIGTGFTNQLTVARTGGQFKAATSTEKVSISIAGGLISGHFLNPADGRTAQFKGGYYGTNGGAGYVLEGAASVGSFVLTPQ